MNASAWQGLVRIWRKGRGGAVLCLIVWAGVVGGGSSPAKATPSLVIDADSGEIMHQQEATASWYPASLTKLMTAYVAMKAARSGRVTYDTPFVVSARAARMAPSKMGFRPGTEVTLDNALKMLMVKSANDIAVTIAEGISGSVEDFAAEMNSLAASLGMSESHFVNPNGLPEDRQVTSARDLAILARALYTEFPEQRGLYGIGALQLGNRIIMTHNGILGRYPGADGMKTGFTCAAGFNVVASAARGGRRLIAVVLGAPSATDRTAKTAALFDKAFSGAGGGLGSLSGLSAGGVTAAPNMRGSVCLHRARGGSWVGETEDFAIVLAGDLERQISRSPEKEFLFESAGLTHPRAVDGRAIAALARPHFEPVPVFIGRKPGWSGPVAQAHTPTPQGAPPGERGSEQKNGDAQPPGNATAYAPEKRDTPAAGPMQIVLPDAASGALAQSRNQNLRTKPFQRTKAASRRSRNPGRKIATAQAHRFHRMSHGKNALRAAKSIEVGAQKTRGRKQAAKAPAAASQ